MGFTMQKNVRTAIWAVSLWGKPNTPVSMQQKAMEARPSRARGLRHRASRGLRRDAATRSGFACRTSRGASIFRGRARGSVHDSSPVALKYASSSMGASHYHAPNARPCSRGTTQSHFRVGAQKESLRTRGFGGFLPRNFADSFASTDRN